MTARTHRPIPRLAHAIPGQHVLLKIDPGPRGTPERERVLIAKDARYGYFNGLIVSLCCPIEQGNMVFGENGWRLDK